MKDYLQRTRQNIGGGQNQTVAKTLQIVLTHSQSTLFLKEASPPSRSVTLFLDRIIYPEGLPLGQLGSLVLNPRTHAYVRLVARVAGELLDFLSGSPDTDSSPTNLASREYRVTQFAVSFLKDLLNTLTGLPNAEKRKKFKRTLKEALETEERLSRFVQGNPCKLGLMTRLPSAGPFETLLLEGPIRN